jgi:PPM family protein phosphatase
MHSMSSDTLPVTRVTTEKTPSVPLRVVSHGVTDRGQQRQKNEDQFAITEVRRVLRVRQSSLEQPEVMLGDQLGHLFIVADGMGGHQAGEVASAMAVAGIENLVLNTIGWLFQLRGDGVLRELHQALRTTDRWLEEAALREPQLHGMGTTLTVAYATDHCLYVAHAGDSRCYRLRDGELQQLTQDHTVVARLVSDGAITAEQAATHRLRNVVMNAVGGGKRGVDPEVHKHGLQPGDIWLLCTDGLTKMLNDEEIAERLAGSGTPAEKGEMLVDEANRRGGEDNITVVIAEFAERPSTDGASDGATDGATDRMSDR